MKSKKVIRAYFILFIFYYIKNNFPVYIKICSEFCYLIH